MLLTSAVAREQGWAAADCDDDAASGDSARRRCRCSVASCSLAVESDRVGVYELRFSICILNVLIAKLFKLKIVICIK